MQRFGASVTTSTPEPTPPDQPPPGSTIVQTKPAGQMLTDRAKFQAKMREKSRLLDLKTTALKIEMQTADAYMRSLDDKMKIYVKPRRSNAEMDKEINALVRKDNADRARMLNRNLTDPTANAVYTV